MFDSTNSFFQIGCSMVIFLINNARTIIYPFNNQVLQYNITKEAKKTLS